MIVYRQSNVKPQKKNEKSFDESRDFFVAVFAVEFKL